MKQAIKRIIPQKLWAVLHQLKSDLFDIYSIKSYSQEGEDMILRRLFEYKTEGFYVDVGAHHPSRFSNTYFFYKLGWSGINIDAMPGSMAPFNRLRPRDVNVEAAVSKDSTESNFFIFNDPALNTFDQELAQSRNVGPYHVIREHKIFTKPLADILGEHIAAGKTIDFLSIDVEGKDLDVLQSNDWQRFRPEYVLVECLKAKNLETIREDPVYRYLDEQGYEFLAKTIYTVIFKSRRLHD